MKQLKKLMIFIAVTAMLTLSAHAHSPDLTDGQENIVKRARQLSEIEWTPREDIWQWDYMGLFKAGVTYTGLPYGQPVETKGYVGWNVSLEKFLSAAADSGSRLYSAYSWFNKISPYYSTDCSGYISYAWDTDLRLTTSSIPDFAEYVHDQSINGLQVGDALNKTGSHVVLISAIDLDSSGRVAGVEIMEATPPITRTTGYGTLGKNTLAALEKKYFNNGYVLYRNPDRYDVDYEHSCAVPIDGDYCDECRSSSLPFRDVSQSAWYRGAVSYVYHNQLYKGTSSSYFSPDSAMTRAMFATALSRMAGIPDSVDGELALISGDSVRMRAEPNTDSQVLRSFDENEAVGVTGWEDGWYEVSCDEMTGWIREDLLKVYDGGITDLKEGRYYTNAVKWAYLMGISTAGGGDFRPGDSLLRQDMAQMLYNYAAVCGTELDGSSSKAFSDDADISSYARKGIYALKAAGIVEGTGENCFAPRSGTTRAQVAQILLNFQKKTENS